MTSFSFNYPLKGRVSKYNPMDVRASTYECQGVKIQFMTLGKKLG